KAAGKKAAAKLGPARRSCSETETGGFRVPRQGGDGIGDGVLESRDAGQERVRHHGQRGRARSDRRRAGAVGHRCTPDGGTKDGGKCASSKLQATGKAALAELLCRSKAATTVHWTWPSTATMAHSVVSGQVISNTNMPDGKFCSPDDTNCATAPASFAGAVYNHTFTVAGTYPYYCTTARRTV